MSRLVFGTGGRFGRLNRPLAKSLVNYAWSRGIRYFDTGLLYGHGRSQSLLLECLADYKHDSECIISTKVTADPLQITHSLVFCNSVFGLGSLDVVFLWGPTFKQLNNNKLFKLLEQALVSGLVKRIGINTHDLNLMLHLEKTLCFPLVSDIMLDFSLAQIDRYPVIENLSSVGLRVWAGTSLAQGYLVESLFERYMRTRSLSYLLRSLINTPTRQLSRNAAPIRQYLRRVYPKIARELPLAFVLDNPYVDLVPIGMLSRRSIDLNLSIESDVSNYRFALDSLSINRTSLPSL